MENMRDTDRIEAFSDGVFTVAVTLLVLDLKVPSPSGGDSWQLLQMLARLWPSLLALLVSFVTILIVWRNHHWVFTLIKSASSRLLYANGILLLAVILIPFPTALVAAYLDQPSANIAVAIYCATYLLLNIGFNLMWWSASADSSLLNSDVSSAAIRRIRRAYLTGFIVYAASVMIALWAPYVGLAACSLMWVSWARMSYSAAGE
jgi:uncharacterized membrane protein